MKKFLVVALLSLVSVSSVLPMKRKLSTDISTVPLKKNKKEQDNLKKEQDYLGESFKESFVLDEDCVCFEEILDEGLNVNWRDSTGKTLLHWASSEGREDVVELLFEKNFNLLNARCNLGRTALFFAARWGKIEVVELLISKGLNVALKDSEGLQAYDFAQKGRDYFRDLSQQGRSSLYNNHKKNNCEFIIRLLEDAQKKREQIQNGIWGCRKLFSSDLFIEN